MSAPVLSVRNLTVEFPQETGVFTAVNDVSFELARGEILGVVGESGAGKSMTGAAIARLIDPPGRIGTAGVFLNGTRIDTLPERDFARLRGRRIGMVFQDPLTSLDPLKTVGSQLIETIRAHLPLSPAAAQERAVELLAETGIPEARARLSAWPHEFSGGMRQRVVIALALAADPDLVIADEPTSALDVSVQAQVIRVLRALCQRRGTAILLITHDMGVIAEIADRVAVMQGGRLVEIGPARDVITAPQAGYTRALIAAIPALADSIRRPVALDAPTLVEVQGLHRSFANGPRSPLPWRKPNRRPAVDDVSFRIPRGQTYGLVGESGSGKSTIARILAGLMPAEAGRVTINGQPVAAGGRKRGQVQMIFQDPWSSLNPRLSVRDIIAEPIRSLGLASSAAEVTERVADLLAHVQLDPGVMARYPHQFSGGQRQRIAIARALSSRPEFIICDEPTSALDVSVQARVLDLMAALQAEFGLTYLLISHNLAVVRQMADRVGVLSQGRLVEDGPTRAVFDAPQHAYTRMLLAAVPEIPRAGAFSGLPAAG